MLVGVVSGVFSEFLNAGFAQYLVWLREEQSRRREARTITQTAAFALGGHGDTRSGDPVRDPDYSKPALDMGMFGVPVKGVPRGSALKEPLLTLPDANEPLYLKSNFGITTVRCERGECEKRGRAPPA